MGKAASPAGVTPLLYPQHQAVCADPQQLACLGAWDKQVHRCPRNPEGTTGEILTNRWTLIHAGKLLCHCIEGDCVLFLLFQLVRGHFAGKGVFSHVFVFFFFLLLLLFFSLKHEFGVTFNLLSGWKCVGYPKGSSMGRESKGCCVALRGCVALAALSHVPRKLALCHLWHFLLLPGWRFVFKIINYFSDLIGLAGEGKIYWKLFPPPFLKQTKKSL